MAIKETTRPEIEGLRALAVIPVILFYAGFDLFCRGFVGVDVFFVLSLIASRWIKSDYLWYFSPKMRAEVDGRAARIG